MQLWFHVHMMLDMAWAIICMHQISSEVGHGLQFTALLRHEMVEDMSVFYNSDKRRISNVIKLGR